MSFHIERAAAGEPVAELWKKVNELVDAMNMIANEEIRVTSKDPQGGKRVMSSTGSVIIVQ